MCKMMIRLMIRIVGRRKRHLRLRGLGLLRGYVKYSERVCRSSVEFN